MNIEELRTYCISKNKVIEDFPFDKNVLVFKVAKKIFALTSLKSWEEQNPAINLKCEPTYAIELREKYDAIQPGFHMNKKHWNTVHLNSIISDNFLKEMIDKSYELVVASLPQKLQKTIYTDEI